MKKYTSKVLNTNPEPFHVTWWIKQPPCKKQQCKWKNISNPHTSLWKKSVTFTFVVAGTSISALCSVLAIEKKGGKKQSCHSTVFNVTTTFQLSPCREAGRELAVQTLPHPYLGINVTYHMWLQQVWYTTQQPFYEAHKATHWLCVTFVFRISFVVVTLSWLVSFYVNHRKSNHHLSDAEWRLK